MEYQITDTFDLIAMIFASIESSFVRAVSTADRYCATALVKNTWSYGLSRHSHAIHRNHGRIKHIYAHIHTETHIPCSHVSNNFLLVAIIAVNRKVDTTVAPGCRNRAAERIHYFFCLVSIFSTCEHLHLEKTRARRFFIIDRLLTVFLFRYAFLQHYLRKCASSTWVREYAKWW